MNNLEVNIRSNGPDSNLSSAEIWAFVCRVFPHSTVERHYATLLFITCNSALDYQSLCSFLQTNNKEENSKVLITFLHKIFLKQQDFYLHDHFAWLFLSNTILFIQDKSHDVCSPKKRIIKQISYYWGFLCMKNSYHHMESYLCSWENSEVIFSAKAQSSSIYWELNCHGDQRLSLG